MNTRSSCLPCHGQFVAAHRTLCVRSADDLTPLLWTLNRYDAVHILSDSFSQEEQIAWERRFAKAYAECGCDAGAIAIVLTLCAAVVWALVNPNARSWQSVGLTALLCLAAALTGKAIGIARARVQLWRDIRSFGRSE